MGNKASVAWQVIRNGEPRQPSATDQQVTESIDTNQIIMSNYPFSGFLPRSLNPEDHVDIEGYIPDGARGFSVNLICDNQNDIAYHFKADFENGMVVINCKFNGMWQEEQTSGDLLFQRGYPFRLKLRISNGEIYTYCEEIFLNQFRLLHPIESAKFIQVWGDIERVTKLSFTYG